MDRDQAIKLMQDLLRRVVEKKASDLFITAGFPPAIKIDGEVRPQSERALTSEQSGVLTRATRPGAPALASCITPEPGRTSSCPVASCPSCCAPGAGFTTLAPPMWTSR